jgi:hypothetical protein
MANAAWVFGGVLLLFLMFVVVANMWGLKVDQTFHRVLGFLCATAAGFFGFFFSGSVALQITGTLAGANIAVQAFSGMALFVLMLWWWLSNPQILQKAEERLSRVEGDTEKLAASVEGFFKKFDDIYPELRKTVGGDNISPSRPHRAFLAREGGDLIFNYPDEIITITAGQLENLPQSEKNFLAKAEQSMDDLESQWWDAVKKRNRASAGDQNKMKKELLSISKNMCSDLNTIFRMLGAKGYRMEDHWAAQMAICAQADQMLNEITTSEKGSA